MAKLYKWMVKKETTVGVARYAPLSAIGLLIGAQVGLSGALTQCAVEEAVELELGMRGFTTYASRDLKMRYTSGTGSEVLMGKALDTAIFVKNAPSYASLGFGGEGYTTFTIASRTGEGLTNALTFTKSRRCVMAEPLYIR